MVQILCEQRLLEHGDFSVGALGTVPSPGEGLGEAEMPLLMDGGPRSQPRVGGTRPMSPAELDAAPAPAGAVRMRMVRGLSAARPGPAPANRM